MGINEIINLCESHYNLSVDSKSRTKDYIRAKRVCCYVASVIYNHPVRSIARSMNVKHGTVIHHVDTAKGLIEIGYRDIIDDIYSIFNIDLNNIKNREKLEKLLVNIDLTQLSEGNVAELADRIKVMVKLYNNNIKDECKTYIGNRIDDISNS